MGFIKVDRKITSHWLWEDKPFAKGQAWIDLLLLATWKENKELYRGELVQRQPGEIACSLSWLADRWGWHRHTVKKFIKLLEGDKMVHAAYTTQGTTITIENWVKYQTTVPAESTTQSTTTCQRRANDVPHHKKVKEEEKKVKNIIPPPRELVSAYAEERSALGKPRVDPEAFCDFYDSKGWMVGKTKMKDWQAAWRNWEKTTKPHKKTLAELAMEQEEEWKRKHGEA